MNNNSTKIEIAKKLQTIEGEIIVPLASKQIKSKKFETNRWPYFLALPFMWLLIIYVIIKKLIYGAFGSKPKINSFFFDGIGKSSRKVKEYASSWRALDIVYNHPFSYSKTIGNLVDEYYWNGLNCQGLRNRRKLIKEELRNVILKINEKKEIKIISLACGSAEVLIEIMAELKTKGIKIKALLIDIDEDALERAKELAKQYNLLEDIKTEKNSTHSIIEIANKFKPDIIEMMGFIDYLKQEDAINLAKDIKESLNPNGYFVTCNINHNLEQYFLTWVINWPMIYRKPKELIEISTKAGFESQRIIYEPLKIHGILIAKK
ncbi:MAG: class I SAM-dependent methyltransferase family protein [Candidatus Paceibacterota bacterium]|jgi:2-polyprenyl-3-methyl-5-hydroxy-6-metoxy-1,4-benzoquinol methylase|nr:class I SAM-dependent methyltransferase family protein [bacterium]